jgi:hypothetical protein
MMRRILLLVTVALVMAVMMAFGAGAASAQPVFLPSGTSSGACVSRSGEPMSAVLVTTPSGQHFACTGGVPSEASPLL